MNEEQKQTAEPAGKWWQTLVISTVNVAISVLLQHYVGGPVGLAAGGASAAAGTAIAHRMQSPRQ